ncbi:MAG: hypothetical protein QW238_01915 [Candidatus Bathyarchaeia archaeon]
MVHSMRKGEILYFERPGLQNTELVLEAVEERLKLGDLRVVVVPVTTGRTAELFSNGLGGRADVVTISEEEAASACRRIAASEEGLLAKLVRDRLEEASMRAHRRILREAFDLTFLPFCGEDWRLVAEPLYAFGQGAKVAVEVSIAAVEVGKVKPYSRIVAVGGTGEGVDTAMVVKTSTQREAFGRRPEKRLSIQEILALPIEKW